MTAENLLKKYDYLVSVKLAKESFKITKGRNCSSIFGSIEIICSDELPSYLQIHLLGEEKVGNKTNYILDDIYQLTTIQWIQHEENKFELPFELSIPNDIPSSIQFNQLDGVYYYLKINVANKTITQPIHLHHTSSLLNNEKVYWGIVNQPEVKWQYEIEFPNIYNFVNTNNQLCIRFKSMSQQKPQQFADCCLLGFQIIQSIQREGHDVEYQTLTSETRILTKLDTTWKEPFYLDFNFMNNNGILPTTSTDCIEIQHDIKLTLAFSNQYHTSLDFPITINGYHPSLVQQNLTNYRLIRDSAILSSSTSSNLSSKSYHKEEKDSAIDILSYNSSQSSNCYLLYK